ncbi:MAG: preprotein translocase subunit SecE [Bacteroidia bacterium]|nr:preprotein translocase subunit SecE [Bacteroidia bacterium]
MSKFRQILREYSDELLYKVQWPTLEELYSSTVTVLVASLLIAVVIGLMDLIFKNGMGILYSLF